MNQRQLEAFKNIMIYGSINEASEKMGVSQPAVSKMISNLENGLGFKLFFRNQKAKARPTPEGIRFYQEVEKFHLGLDHLKNAAKKIKAGEPSKLSVCATPALATYVFPRVIQRYQLAYPEVEILLECFSSTEIVSKLQRNLSDVAILQAFAAVPGIVQEHLITAPQVCAIPEDHPLAKREIIRPHDLKNEPVLNILSSGLTNWDKVQQTFKDHGISTKKSIGIQNSHTGYSLIAQGLAIGLIEPFAAPAWLNNGVVIRPFEPSVTFDYVIAYAASEYTVKSRTNFIKMVRDRCSEYEFKGAHIST